VVTSTACNPRSSIDRETVVAVFHSHTEAQKAVRELKDLGFNDEQIGIATKDLDGTYQKQTDGKIAVEGATVGAVDGPGVGLWGLKIVVGVLPVIGPVIAGGALAAIAVSAGNTAAAGRVSGALIGLGIPQEESEYYEGEFNSGRTVVTVKTGKTQFSKTSRILDDSNSYDYNRRESDYANNAKAMQRVDTEGKIVAINEVRDVDHHI